MSTDYGMILRDYSYAYFSWAGNALESIFKGIEKDLEAACMRIHPEVYFSLVSVIAIGAGIIPLFAFGLIATGLIRIPFDLGISPIILVPVSLGLPLVIIVISTFIPKTVIQG